MKYEASSLAEVQQTIARIRAAKGSFQTNYFQQQLVGRSFHVAASDRSVIFLNDDVGFHRVYYFSSSTTDLRAMLVSLQWPSDLVIGYITKSQDPELLAAFSDASFKPYCTFRKMRCDALPEAKTNRFLKFAQADQIDELHARLFADFDRYSEHLPSRELLAEYVSRGGVIINADANAGGRIVGYVIFQVLGQHVNCNFIFNTSGNAIDWLILQKNFYGLMSEQGIRRGFIWVKDTNLEVIDMYRKQVWYFDGVASHFLVRQTT